MLYPVIDTLSNVYGADHISNTLDQLRTVLVLDLFWLHNVYMHLH